MFVAPDINAGTGHIQPEMQVSHNRHVCIEIDFKANLFEDQQTLPNTLPKVECWSWVRRANHSGDQCLEIAVYANEEFPSDGNTNCSLQP